MPARKKCPLRSKDSMALSKRGWELTREGDRATALACHLAATALPDAKSYDWYHLARLQDQLQLPDARASFERAVALDNPALDPAAASESYFHIGKHRRDRGELREAVDAYTAATDHDPSQAGSHVMLGVTLRELGRSDEAIAAYAVGLRIMPSIAPAQYNLAQALSGLGRADEAITSLRAAIRIDPGFGQAYDALGEALGGRGAHAEAIDVLRGATHLKPESAAAHYALGKAYFITKRLELAIAAGVKALGLPDEPGLPRAYIHNDLGNAYSDSSGRQAEVLHHYSAAAALLPNFAEAHSNVGTIYKDLGRHEEAASQFTRAIRAKPTLCEAYKNLGSSYAEIQGRLTEAVSAFEGALRINPQFWPALYSLLDSKQFLCEWKGRGPLVAQLADHLHELHTRRNVGAGPDERMHGGLSPFQTIVMPISHRAQRAVTENRAAKDISFATANPLSPPLRWRGDDGPPSREKPLRLGFFSSDFGDHPVGHALLPWFEALRSRPRLRIVCFASDAAEKHHAGTPLRRAIAAQAHAFFDVSELSDAEVARLINEQRVHVLINLVGHTAGARHVVTQYAPAPVQAMHYGYPGTTALPAMGYMQLDAVAAPPGHARDYTEKMAYFPHCHFVAAHSRRYPHVHAATRRAQPWARASGFPSAAAQHARAVDASDGSDAGRRDLGLGRYGSSDSSFALCNFNQLYKMDPTTLHVWTNGLRRVPGSFFWLTQVTVRAGTSELAAMAIASESAALGVNAHRLGYSLRFPEKDYVPFRALADLMLDNFAYNAHTTGADTFWAGVPAVVSEHRHLAGRATSSFASALGEAGMVARTLRAYEDTVAELGARRSRLWQLRRRLGSKLKTAPFFDLERLAVGQERLAAGMWEVQAAARHAAARGGRGGQTMHVIAAR